MIDNLGSRIVEQHDFGFVNLNVQATVPEDSGKIISEIYLGVYMVKAKNKSGETITSANLNVKGINKLILYSSIFMH
jgi:hypothetical protein